MKKGLFQEQARVEAKLPVVKDRSDHADPERLKPAPAPAGPSVQPKTEPEEMESKTPTHSLLSCS